MTPFRHTKTQRALLVKLGISHFNATQIIPILLTQPATTDPKQPAVILLVRALQYNMHLLGAPIDNTGYLDEPTSALLTKMFGNDGWINLPWAEVVKVVVTARQNRYSLKPKTPAPPTDYVPQATGDFELSTGGKLAVIGGIAAALYFWKR